jgi:hypothetical protein
MLYNKNQMLKKKTFLKILLATLVILASVGTWGAVRVTAAPTETCPDGTTISGGDCSTHQNTTDRSRCRNGATVPDTHKYLNSPAGSSKCLDGTPLPITGPSSAYVPPEEFCATHGGYMDKPVAAPPASTTPTSPGGSTNSTSSPSNTTGSATPAPKKTCGEVIEGTAPPTGTAANPNYYCVEDSKAFGCTSDYAGSVRDGCGIVQRYINPLVRFLAIALGIVVTIMIAIGGLQYSSAGGDPQRIAAAKKRIFNAVFALVAFGLLYGFLNFIIPGGL